MGFKLFYLIQWCYRPKRERMIANVLYIFSNFPSRPTEALSVGVEIGPITTIVYRLPENIVLSVFLEIVDYDVRPIRVW